MNIKKISSLAVMLCIAAAAFAQGEKTSLYISKFVNNSKASEVVCNNVRQEIISGLTATQRLTIVDANTVGENFPTGKKELAAALNEREIPFFLEGIINTVTTTRKTNSEGKVSYEANVSYSITLIESETAETKASETYTETWYSGGTADESVAKAVENVSKRMKRFVDNNFKVEAMIVELKDVDPKKGVKSCYINAGSADGLSKGQICEVYGEKTVAGRVIKEKVGEIKIEEVNAEDMSTCTVKNGGPAIKAAFEKGKVTVITRAKKDILGGLGLGL